MKEWLGRIAGAVGMGLAWAVGWGLLGAVIGIISGFLGIPEESVLDPWIALATPGFAGGVIFFAVLRLAEGGRRFSELPLRRLAAWGAVAGLVLGVLPFVFGTMTSEHPLWFLVLAIIGSTTSLSSVSAVGSAMLFRYAARQQPPPAGAEVGQ